MVFRQFSKEIQKLIEKKGFTEPTISQKMGIPEILSGKNVLIIAPTSSGKTESAFLPLLDIIHRKKMKPVSLLYITPLKSLNRDMLKRLFWWADNLDIDITVRHGDTSQQERKEQREMPAKVFITTPETLGAILPGKKMRKHLRNVEFVIVDEIHELCENKRGTQLSLLLERLKNIAGDFQRIGLSATVGSPKAVAEFLGKNVKIIRADSEKKFKIKVILPEENAKKTADQLLITESAAARLNALYKIINNHKSSLVFTNTRQTAEVLSSRLRQLDKEFLQDVHHSSISKVARINIEENFKKEKLKTLICTSSLELGIDIGSIETVIQYMSPRQTIKLIQRVGRSGHTIKEESKGIILASSDDDIFESAVIAKRALEKRLEKIKIYKEPKDVLASQIVGLTLEKYGITSKEIFSIIKEAYPFRKMEEKEFIKLIKFLANLHFFWLSPYKANKNSCGENYRLRRSRKAWQYYYENLSTIPDIWRYKVISVVENEPVGYLDEGFVAEYGEPGNSFVFRGRTWKIVDISENKVFVEPFEDMQSAVPAWEGELIPVSLTVAKEVGELRKTIAKALNSKKNIIEKIKQQYHVNDFGVKNMIKTIKKQKKYFVPDFYNWLLEQHQDFLILHTCAGSLVNNTLGRYLSFIISEETGISVQLKTDPYRIIIKSFAKPEQVIKILNNAHDMKNTLIKNLERSSLFKWRFIHVAKRFGVMQRNVKFQNISLPKVIDIYRNSPLYDETLKEIFKEKMDLANTKKILDMIKNGQIKIKFIKKLTPLGEIGLLYQFSEIMKPKTPKHEIFRAFKKRLLNTKLQLICTHCLNYHIVKSVKNIKNQPVCPKCGSGLLAVLSKYNNNALKLLKKEKSVKLTKKEKKEIEKMQRTASLMITYGKKFAMVQAARGVGPETGARILAKLPKDEEQLLKYIFEAEKNYQKNKKYWKE
ncbi:MAG: DEAD/DEAH box helicase [Candidatus Aenigmarchaeota archaeon]|nr:DEAD/DEAH box helicase [Candidatus Aenigmarchaeota archaeon]